MVIGIIAVFIILTTYFFVLGANKDKSKEEKNLEDEEQMTYLNKHKTEEIECEK